jgi:hypothetical protein
MSSLWIMARLNLGISFRQWYRTGAELLAKTHNVNELPASIFKLGGFMSVDNHSIKHSKSTDPQIKRSVRTASPV